MMNNINQFYLMEEKLNSSFKIFLTYLTIFLFSSLACFVSFSVSSFISNTMSISIIEAEVTPVNDEETLENTDVVIKVNKGDTLYSILSAQNFSKQDINQITKLIKTKLLSSALKAGQVIKFDYNLKIEEENDEDLALETRTLNKMTLKLDNLKSLEITKNQENFEATIITAALDKFIVKSEVVIKTNFMTALKSLGLSTNNIVELINSYSYQIDFQRQIQPGDKITVISEKLISKDGKVSQKGKILYASLNLSGNEYNIYQYKHHLSDENNFFSEDGKSAKRSLLRTPINVVRISSHYGNRVHPIHGYTIMHKGIDFSAPSGTPIKAAGDGVIIEAGWKSGYGKFIQIKHSSTLSTAYAHASSFAKNMRPGMKVKQGQVIAYVGRTGRTTGDHLHYEVKINGKHVNPMSIKTTAGIELKGKDLVKFNEVKAKFKNLKQTLHNNIEIPETNVAYIN